MDTLQRYKWQPVEIQSFMNLISRDLEFFLYQLKSMKPCSENWVPDIKVWQAKLGYPKLDATPEKIIVSDYLTGEA